MIEGAFIAVAVVGLLHGLEPGHGWPIAVLYSIRSRRPTLMALVSSSVISIFHLVSSVAVVVAYVLLMNFLSFSLPYVNYLAGLGLAVLGIRFLTEKPKDGEQENHEHFHEDFGPGEHAHEHEHSGFDKHTHAHKHSRRLILSLSGIAIVALILGFAHEEEFALLALAVGGVDPMGLMLVYAGAVALGLIGVTLVAVRVFGRLEERLRKYQHLIPKISGLILLVMAASFLLGVR